MVETEEREAEATLLVDCSCVLGLSIAWLFFRGDLAARALALTPVGPGGAGLAGYYLYIGTMLVLAAVLPLLSRLFPDRRKVLLILFAVSSLGAPMMLGGCFLEGAAGLAAGCVGSLLLGLFVVASVLCWGSILVRFSARRILVLVSLAFALSSLISFISMFPQVTYLVMLAVLPAASAGLCLLCVRESDRNRSEGPSSGCELPVPAKPAKGTYSLVAVLAVFCVVGFSIRGLVAPLEASAPLAEVILVNAATLVIGLVAALMGWRMRSVHACVTLVTRFIMVGLFAALCLSIILGTSPYALVINGISLVARAGITYALFLVACLYGRWYMSDRLLGMGLLFMLPQAVASTVRSLLFQFETALGDYTSFIAPAMLFVLVIAMLVLTVSKGGSAEWPRTDATDERSSGSSEGEGAGRDDRRAPAIDDAMALSLGLTPRERDIADCLAKGYTLQKTADELFISMNTVRTHAKAVYRKMGVASKQELIDAVEQRRGR